MLIDPDFLEELEDSIQYTERTLLFIKKIMRVFTYVEAETTGTTLSGQVKKGDGTDHEAAIDVIVRSVSDAGGLIAVTSGTAKAGDGTQACWLTTTSGGAFAVSITGVGEALLEVVPSGGVSKFFALTGV